MSGQVDPKRAEMMSKPYAPQDVELDMRHALALEYIALYLGEIHKDLARIADSLEDKD